MRPHNLTINLARGDALGRSQLRVDPDRYREVLAEKRRLQEIGLLGYFDIPLGAPGLGPRPVDVRARRGRGPRSPAPAPPCTAGNLSTVTFEDGAVHPCEILGEPWGQLAEFDWDLERLWSTAAAQALRRQIRDTRCACTWECAQADNVLIDPVPGRGSPRRPCAWAKPSAPEPTW